MDWLLLLAVVGRPGCCEACSVLVLGPASGNTLAWAFAKPASTERSRRESSCCSRSRTAFSARPLPCTSNNLVTVRALIVKTFNGFDAGGPVLDKRCLSHVQCCCATLNICLLGMVAGVNSQCVQTQLQSMWILTLVCSFALRMVSFALYMAGKNLLFRSSSNAEP